METKHSETDREENNSHLCSHCPELTMVNMVTDLHLHPIFFQ